MKRGTRKSSLSKKGTRLKREARGTARHAASFVPGVSLALNIHGTAKSAGRTARAASDYGSQLYREVKRQIRKRNPFI